MDPDLEARAPVEVEPDAGLLLRDDADSPAGLVEDGDEALEEEESLVLVVRRLDFCREFPLPRPNDPKLSSFHASSLKVVEPLLVARVEALMGLESEDAESLRGSEEYDDEEGYVELDAYPAAE